MQRNIFFFLFKYMLYIYFKYGSLLKKKKKKKKKKKNNWEELVDWMWPIMVDSTPRLQVCDLVWKILRREDL